MNLCAPGSEVAFGVLFWPDTMSESDPTSDYACACGNRVAVCGACGMGYAQVTPEVAIAQYKKAVESGIIVEDSSKKADEAKLKLHSTQL